MNSSLAFHPVFDFQPRNTAEVFDVASHQNKVFFNGCSSNEHIHVTNRFPSAFKHPTYLSVFSQSIDRVLFEKVHDFYNILKMLFPFRFECTKIQFGQCNVRNLTFINTHLSDMLYHTWFLFNKSNTCACIEQICSMCLQPHTYQVSTSVTISAPCRNSFAISKGLLSPPQSLWNRPRAASNLASDSSFHVGTLSIFFFRFFSASASSRSICAVICSASQRRSLRLKLLSIVSMASMGIVPTIVFILSLFMYSTLQR